MGNPSLALLQHPPVGPRNDNRLVIALCLCGSIHRIRALLKVLGAHGWRCIRASEEPGVTLTLTEVTMEKSELQKLQQYAAGSRSQVAGFGGAIFIKWDYKTGTRTAGKANTDIAGRKFVADVPDAMAGFQRLEKGQKPQYALTRVLGDDDPIKRNELSDANPAYWLDDNKDPWVPATGLPLYDDETRQNYIIVAIYQARDAVADLLTAVAEHGIDHPEDAGKLPLVKFCVRKYPKDDGTTGYALYFDIDGWVDRPAAVQHVRPPPLNITSQADKGNGKAASASTSTAASKPSTDDKAKPQRKIAVVGGKPDYDDEVPFR
jgi:hypothetical protein